MRLYLVFLVICFLLFSCGQTQPTEKSEGITEIYENELINYFSNDSYSKGNVSKDSLYYTSFVDGNFLLSISDSLIHFNFQQKTIENPYFEIKYENSDEKIEQVKNYPKSYSVIYFNHLISLFENGKFACFNLINFERNLDFENRINTKKFDFHWIIDGKLTAQKGDKYYKWEDSKWIQINKNYPFKNRPILYGNSEFIIYSDCHGEFGGSVYFYEIQSEKIYFTESTCANTVWKTEEGFHILSSLGHMMGSSDMKVISNPRELPEFEMDSLGLIRNDEASGYSNNSSNILRKFNFFDLQFFSKFNYKNEDLYLGYVKGLPFFGKIQGENIQIVYPFIHNKFYIHEPVTHQYGDFTLINLPFYGIGIEREVSNLIVHENNILKLDWNELK